MSTPANLLAECQLNGIRLLPVEPDGITIDAPPAALTPELLARLKAHKADLLALLRPRSEAEHRPRAPAEPPTSAAEAVCRCGSRTWHDVVIHNGQSVRRDCNQCGRFVEFTEWYSRNALQKEK